MLLIKSYCWFKKSAARRCGTVGIHNYAQYRYFKSSIQASTYDPPKDQQNFNIGRHLGGAHAAKKKIEVGARAIIPDRFVKYLLSFFPDSWYRAARYCTVSFIRGALFAQTLIYIYK